MNVVVVCFYMVSTTKLIYTTTYMNCISLLRTIPVRSTIFCWWFFVSVCLFLSLVAIVIICIDSRLCSAVVVRWCCILLAFYVWCLFDVISLCLYPFLKLLCYVLYFCFYLIRLNSHLILVLVLYYIWYFYLWFVFLHYLCL